MVTFPRQFDKPASLIRTLVIDDNQAVRTFVERVLRDAGYETTTAKDGVSARELVMNTGAPDLVITDQSMPRMSGQAFSRWVRERYPDVKVLYLSGYADPAFGDREALEANEGYLEKPCTVRGLLQAVSLLLYRRVEPRATLRTSRSL